jgi:hypothetical protein
MILLTVNAAIFDEFAGAFLQFYIVQCWDATVSTNFLLSAHLYTDCSSTAGKNICYNYRRHRNQRKRPPSVVDSKEPKRSKGGDVLLVSVKVKRMRKREKRATFEEC